MTRQIRSSTYIILRIAPYPVDYTTGIGETNREDLSKSTMTWPNQAAHCKQNTRLSSEVERLVMQGPGGGTSKKGRKQPHSKGWGCTHRCVDKGLLACILFCWAGRVITVISEQVSYIHMFHCKLQPMVATILHPWFNYLPTTILHPSSNHLPTTILHLSSNYLPTYHHTASLI